MNSSRAVGGSGLNAGRNIPRNGKQEDYPDSVHQEAESLLHQSPEMIIAENVKVSGVINFKRLFRIDGNVRGTFMAPVEASLIIGKKGVVTGDLSGINTTLVEGTVNGDISVRSVSLRSSAVVNGNIRCRYIEIQPKAVVKGNVYVMSDEEYDSTLPVVEPEKPPPPVKTVMLIVDPQVDHLSAGSYPVPGAEDDSKRVADYIQQNTGTIDEIYITMESRHRMHISHGVFWINEQGEHPRPNTIISFTDIQNQVWTPVNSEHLEHCLNYTRSLEEQGNVHQLVIAPEHCLIGTTGHSIVPSINNAVQKWTEVTGKQVHYVMKGTNCMTEMYSALSADVPVGSDASTYADNELIANLYGGDRVLVCGQALSHSVNYTVRDMIRLFRMYQRQFSKKAVPESNDSEVDVAKKIFLLSDCSSTLRGFENQTNNFLSYLREEGANVVSVKEMVQMK